MSMSRRFLKSLFAAAAGVGAVGILGKGRCLPRMAIWQKNRQRCIRQAIMFPWPEDTSALFADLLWNTCLSILRRE